MNEPDEHSEPIAARAKAAFALLFCLNLANFIDRWSLSSFLPLISRELALTDAQAGSLGSFFLVSLMLASFLLGHRLDPLPRWKTLGVTCILWSLVAGMGAFSPNFAFLGTTRLLLGAAEAVYAAIAPVLVADLFPARVRTRMMAAYALAVPLGSALGFGLGGVLADGFGWRVGLMITGFGSAPLGVLALFMKQGEQSAEERGTGPGLPLMKAIKELLKDERYRWILVGSAGTTAALGALGMFLPTDLQRRFELSEGQAGLTSGALLGLTAIVGTMGGGLFVEKREKLRPWLRYDVTAVSLLIGTVLGAGYFFGPNLTVALCFLALSIIFVFVHVGPVQRAIVEQSPAHLRAWGFAFNVFAAHAIGDVWSQPVTGWLSDLGVAAGLTPAAAMRDALAMVAMPAFALAAVAFWRGGKVERRVAAEVP